MPFCSDPLKGELFRIVPGHYILDYTRGMYSKTFLLHILKFEFWESVPQIGYTVSINILGEATVRMVRKTFHIVLVCLEPAGDTCRDMRVAFWQVLRVKDSCSCCGGGGRKS